MFPALREPVHMNVRFKNVANQTYLCVKIDEQGKHTLGTKTLNSNTDPELDFSLYYYTHSEAGETKLVLPVHQNTKVCFSMTQDKKIQISSLVRKMDMNEVDGDFEDPLQFTTADNRFFYIKTSGTNYALEAMNGADYKNFLIVNKNNMIDVLEITDGNYPDKALFSIEDLDEITNSS